MFILTDLVSILLDKNGIQTFGISMVALNLYLCWSEVIVASSGQGLEVIKLFHP